MVLTTFVVPDEKIGPVRVVVPGATIVPVLVVTFVVAPPVVIVPPPVEIEGPPEITPPVFCMVMTLGLSIKLISPILRVLLLSVTPPLLSLVTVPITLVPPEKVNVPSCDPTVTGAALALFAAACY